jgi:hypothetical protein
MWPTHCILFYGKSITIEPMINNLHFFVQYLFILENELLALSNFQYLMNKYAKYIFWCVFVIITQQLGMEVWFSIILTNINTILFIYLARPPSFYLF